jgi:predicted ArsR family transcriptional regulator
LLAEPSRRRVYDYVAGRRESVSKDDVALALEIGRTLAAYHLERLTDAGLLTASYARRTGKTGPGAGRSAKLYAVSSREFTASEPARDYEALAHLLAAAIAADGSGEGQGYAGRAAHSAGVAVGRAATGRTPGDILDERGYAPFTSSREIRLANCPFHRLAHAQRELVCGLNHALIQGILEGLDITDFTAVLDPMPGQCCVALVPA